jgi:methylenetetrahydrofolate dehydrogenase (NADP+)/methenyltetrahydrofolate cyclohydrolase
VEICLIDDSDIKSKISKADLLITAVGRPHYFKENMLKKGAGVIDIGISRKGKKIKGDFDLTELNDKISFYTPVPGGIGPMTVAFLLKNTLELFKIKNKHK